jgi:hypothetical protein
MASFEMQFSVCGHSQLIEQCRKTNAMRAMYGCARVGGRSGSEERDAASERGREKEKDREEGHASVCLLIRRRSAGCGRNLCLSDVLHRLEQGERETIAPTVSTPIRSTLEILFFSV